MLIFYTDFNLSDTHAHTHMRSDNEKEGQEVDRGQDGFGLVSLLTSHIFMEHRKWQASGDRVFLSLQICITVSVCFPYLYLPLQFSMSREYTKDGFAFPFAPKSS